MESTNLLKKVIQTVEMVGEEKLIQNLNDLQNKNKFSIQRLALIVSEKFPEVDPHEICTQVVTFPHRLTIAKHIFIFLGNKYFRKEINRIGYNRQTIHKVKTIITGLLPAHPEHAEIIETVNTIETQLLKTK